VFCAASIENFHLCWPLLLQKFNAYIFHMQMSKFCGACPACTFKTKQPATDCKFGSRCTRENCVFAHASPAGSAHMAGPEPRACTSGIKCDRRDCPYAHPSRAMTCKMTCDEEVCCPDCQTSNSLTHISTYCIVVLSMFSKTVRQ
jgi:hypothetical protein